VTTATWSLVFDRRRTRSIRSARRRGTNKDAFRDPSSRRRSG
jgi:hypothetical protein